MATDIISIKTDQIVSDTGKLNIDVFKNFELPDNSSLCFNSHGQGGDAILLNCPNGGIKYNSLTLHSETSEFNILSHDKIHLNSFNTIKIDSKSIIEIGNYESGMLLDLINDSLNINFNQTEESCIKLNTTNFNLTCNKEQISINEELFSFKSNNKIEFGNIYNNTLSIDCRKDSVTVNGNLYVTGNITYEDEIIEYRKIKHVVQNHALFFDLEESPTKDWEISSLDGGIFFKKDTQCVSLSNNSQLLNLSVNSLYISKNKSHQTNNYLSIEDTFTLNYKGDIESDGSLSIKGDLNINNNILCTNKGILKVTNDILIDNISLSNIFKYSVGKDLKFTSIQDCIDYIEQNELYTDQDIFIEIYSNMVYIENVVISKPNINLIGKYKKCKIIGSITINIQNTKDVYEILLQNIIIETSLNKNNSFNLDHNNISIKDVCIQMSHDSFLDFVNIKTISFENVDIRSNNTNQLSISDTHRVDFNNCHIDIIKNIVVNKVLYYRTFLYIKKNWSLITTEPIKFIFCDFNSTVKDIISFKDTFYRTKTVIILDSIIKLIDSDGIFYPKLALQPNYNT